MTRKRLLIIVVIITLLVGIAIYSMFDPSTTNLFPKCIFKSVTGYDCPGCGSQRAIHSILHGHIFTAFRYNALLILSIPYLILLGLAELFPKKFPRLNKTLTSLTATIIILSAIILWWILRNVFHW